MVWIIYQEDIFNSDKFRHIWVEKCVNGFFLMGEFEGDGEEVVISETFEDKTECLRFLSILKERLN